jgi:hypothetical protein
VQKVVVVAPEENKFYYGFPNAVPTASQWVNYH